MPSAEPPSAKCEPIGGSCSSINNSAAARATTPPSPPDHPTLPPGQPRHHPIQQHQVQREQNIQPIMPHTNNQRQSRRHRPQDPGDRLLRSRIPPCLPYRRNGQQRIREYSKDRRDPRIAGPIIQPHTAHAKQQKFPVFRSQRKIPAQQCSRRDSQTADSRTPDTGQTPLPALVHNLRHKTRSH